MAFSLSEIADDPDLGTSFLIIRTTGSFAAGGWVAGTPVQIPASGVIAVAEDEALLQIPEGDRVAGAMQLISSQQIYETQATRAGISDKVLWNGNYYRVVGVAPWADFGFWSAVMVRMSGE
ncbi:MAG TPA: hypothetical protein VJ801_10420 [Polyangia bacterium]|jgi:hypothetical protein|nr:hypothetical protein [Polyangia bacterium]